MPELIHLPLLRTRIKANSQAKKPHKFELLQGCGALPGSFAQLSRLMGWSMPDEREIFDMQDMIKALDLDRISTSGPVFDQTKLKWLNGQYLRKLDDSDYS